MRNKTTKKTLLAAALIAAGAVLPLAASETPSQPNILVILADDLGWADLSCYGSTFHESPNLDRLAAQSIRFTDAYAASPYCSPSRASLLTGRNPARLGITDWIPGTRRSGKFAPVRGKLQLPLAETTIAEALREGGYATWHVGKWHLGREAFYPEHQGFDVNIAGGHMGHPPSYFWPYEDEKEAARRGYHGAGIPGLKEGGKEGEHIADRLAAEAVKLIENRDPAKPFFLYLSYYDVHKPVQSKPELVAKYQAKAKALGLPAPKAAPTYPLGRAERGSVRGRRAMLLEQQVDPVFAAMVETLDGSVGHVLDKLEELGIADNTLVIFTSDNGGDTPTSNRPLRGGKGWLYEGGVRVPFLVRWRGIPTPGQTSAVPVVITDLAPTLLAAAGLDPRPQDFRDGVDLMPLIESGTKPERDAIFWHYPHYGFSYGVVRSGPCSSLRVGDWKLIHWIENDSVELFNLAEDIGEENDLAAQHPERAAAMRKQLEAYRQKTGARMPTPLKQSEADAGAGLKPSLPRIEYMDHPAGIDTAHPRFSWEVLATDPAARGLKQSAYQILVASSKERLAKGQADLWDSGKVPADDTTGIEYAGKPLASRMQCWWKVRIYDQNDKASDWSEPASWSMGLLSPKDWQAQWIAPPRKQPVTTTHWGYASLGAAKKDEPKWVQIDLGAESAIDSVKLWPAWPVIGPSKSNVRWGEGFPRRFKIEVGNAPDLADARVVVDQTEADWPHPDNAAVLLEFPVVNARYVRLTATEHRGVYNPMILQTFGDDETGYPPVEMKRPFQGRSPWKLMLAEMEVMGAGKILSTGKAVSALDSCNDPEAKPTDLPIGVRSGKENGWADEFLTDGRTEADPGSDYHHHPVPMFRKAFSVNAPVKRATLYATALGCYEATINGQRVGDAVIQPDPLAQGWQNMHERRIRYQTHDVTDLLAEGENAAGFLLADGFYRLYHFLDHYGNASRFKRFPGPDSGWLLGQLEIEYADGRREVIATDSSWLCHTDGPWRQVSIYDGAKFDASKRVPGWDTAGFSTGAGWAAPRVRALDPKVPLSGTIMEPIRVVRTLEPVARTEPKPGVVIYDFGHNFSGICRATLDGPAGTVVKFRHSPVLRPDGTLHVDHLCGSWDAADEIVLDGKGPIEFVPQFTYHGCGYLEVTGLTPGVTIRNVQGQAFASDMSRASTFESSSPTLNALVEMSYWSLLSNLLGSMLDCADRDERYPWGGDCHPLQATAYMFDAAAFHAATTRLLMDGANHQGLMSGWIRALKGNVSYSPCWGDTVVFGPHLAWLNYADQRSLELGHANNAKFLGTLAEYNPDWLPKNRVNVIGDWVSARSTMAPDATTWRQIGGKEFSATKELFALAWWANSTIHAEEMALAAGDKAAAETYADMKRNLLRTFAETQMQPDGSIGRDSQSDYALFFSLGLDRDLTDDERAKIAARMPGAIERYHSRLSTGSVTTWRFLEALSANGCHAEACELVLDPRYPSPAHFVEFGLRTLPEELGSVRKGFGINPGRNGTQNGMMHMSFPGIYDWIFSHVAGLEPDITRPGWKHFTIAPKPGGGLTRAKATYRSIRGLIKTEWNLDGDALTLEVTVPPNTTATAHIPAKSAEAVTESGKPLAQAKGVVFQTLENGRAVCELQSGSYRFKVNL